MAQSDVDADFEAYDVGPGNARRSRWRCQRIGRVDQRFQGSQLLRIARCLIRALLRVLLLVLRDPTPRALLVRLRPP